MRHKTATSDRLASKRRELRSKLPKRRKPITSKALRARANRTRIKKEEKERNIRESIRW